MKSIVPVDEVECSGSFRRVLTNIKNFTDCMQRISVVDALPTKSWCLNAGTSAAGIRDETNDNYLHQSHPYAVRTCYHSYRAVKINCILIICLAFVYNWYQVGGMPLTHWWETTVNRNREQLLWLITHSHDETIYKNTQPNHPHKHQKQWAIVSKVDLT